MSDAKISLTSQIKLRPLSKQVENGVAVIGWQNQFLEIPTQGLKFLAWLDEGLTLTEARQRFEADCNPFPEEDLLEMIHIFREYDFIARVDDQDIAPRQVETATHTNWVPQSVARALFSTPVLLGWMVVVIPAMVLWVTTPSLWPRWDDYFWIDYNFLIILIGLLVWLISMFFHELAHLLAARAKGIEATITITERLGFIPMSQTIMHNIWAIPRQSRLLPIAAGMVVDILRISLLIYVLYAHLLGWLSLPLLLTNFLKFYLLLSTLYLTAQFWLFSRMDGYFLLSSLFGQRNLQADTYHWLKFKIGRVKQFDPPADGMKFIYIYALITLVWGGLFMGQFLLIQLPIKLRILWESVLKVNAGYQATPLDFADGLAAFAGQMIDICLLAYAHWRRY